MNRNSPWSFSVALCAFLVPLGACDDNDSNDSNQPAANLSLVGEWQADCFSEEWNEAQGREDKFSFYLDKGFKREVVMFKDDACQDPVGTFETKGEMNDGPEIVDGAGAREINFTIQEMTFTPRSDTLTTVLNAVSYCGVRDWKIDVGVDLLALDCAGESIDRGESSFDAYKIDGEKLYFGSMSLWLRQGDATTRPSQVNTDHEYKLIKRF